MHKNRSVGSCGVLRNINNQQQKFNTIKSGTAPKPPIKSRALRDLEAELGVERYKNRLLAEEIEMNKEEIGRSLKYDRQLKALEVDFELLSASVRRSKVIQDQQKEEIQYLKSVLGSLRRIK